MHKLWCTHRSKKRFLEPDTHVLSLWCLSCRFVIMSVWLGSKLEVRSLPMQMHAVVPCMGM